VGTVECVSGYSKGRGKWGRSTVRTLEKNKYLDNHITRPLRLLLLIDHHSLHQAILRGLVSDLSLKLAVNVFRPHHVLKH